MDLAQLNAKQLRLVELLLKLRDRRITFAKDHHLSTRGHRLNLTDWPHCQAWYDSLSRKIVIQGSVQSLKTEWMIVDHLASASLGLSIFYVVSKYEQRNTYVQNRINRVVELVTEYKRYIKSGFFDSMAIKHFGKGAIKYVGSNAPADFREFPGDDLRVDEYDDCDQENLILAADRLQMSPYKLERYIGNPTVPNFGINAKYLETDQRRWFISCLSCGKPAQVDWFTHVVEPIKDINDVPVDYVLRDKEWSPGKRDILAICDKCGGVLDLFGKSGHWKATADSPHEGYLVSMLASGANTCSYMYETFREGIHNPAKMARFRNSFLGEADEGENVKLTSESLNRCSQTGYFVIDRKDVAHLPDDVCDGPCSMGIDVGGSLDVRVSKIVGDKRVLVFVGKINNFEEAKNIIKRYRVLSCVVDSMPESHAVQEFQETAECDVWLCRVRGDGTDRQMMRNENEQIITIDRTELLDRNFTDILARRCVLPENFRTLLGGSYLKEMTCLVRRAEENDKGEIKMQWTKGEDHQRFADAFDLLAADMLKGSFVNSLYVG